MKFPYIVAPVKVPAMVGFTATRLRYPLYGYAGFLQYFNTEFRGDDCEVFLTPNKGFSGSVTQRQP